MDILIIADFISKLSPVLTIILTAFILNPINNFNERKKKKLSNIKEVEFMIDKLDEKFKKDFVMRDFKENYFFSQTGIETNEQSIESYINLKEKLNGKFTWNSIKLAMDNFNFENGQIVVQTKRITKIFAKFTSVLSLLFIIFGAFIFIYYIQYINLFSSKDYIKLILTALLPSFCGIYLLHLITPLRITIAIEKKLKNNG